MTWERPACLGPAPPIEPSDAPSASPPPPPPAPLDPPPPTLQADKKLAAPPPDALPPAPPIPPSPSLPPAAPAPSVPRGDMKAIVVRSPTYTPKNVPLSKTSAAHLKQFAHMVGLKKTSDAIAGERGARGGWGTHVPYMLVRRLTLDRSALSVFALQL